MNQYGYQHQPVTPPHPQAADQSPAPQPTKRRRWLTPVIAVGALLVGVGIGTSTDPEPEVIEAEPEVITETETVEVEVPVEVPVEVTPQSCVDALGEADQVFLGVADLMQNTWLTAVESAFYHDVPGMEQATAEMEDFLAFIDGSRYREHADACLAG